MRIPKHGAVMGMLLVGLTTIHAFSFHASTRRQSLASARLSSSFGGTSRLPSSLRRYHNPTAKSTQLSMHMGHSHAHHHHHHHQEQHDKTPQPPPKTWGGHMLRFSRRPVVRLVFAALVVFVPALIRRRALQLHRADFAAFFLISAGLSFADGARREFKRIFEQVRDWKDGILKHAPKEQTRRSLIERLFSKSREQAADRVTLFGVLINLVLSVGKLIVGITCHSSALVADAGHSMSDLFSDFVTLWAVQIARLPPDDDHPYGHGKFEAVGALFLALTLLGTGLSVGAVSYGNLMEIIKLGGSATSAAAAAAVQVPTFPALLMAFLSIVSKEWLYRITRRVGEDLNSQVVLANAWHHRSDAYSSILAMVSIGLAMLVPGLLAADSAAGLLVGGMICMTGAEIMGESVKQLTDASADEALVKKVQGLALEESDDVLAVTNIRTRQMGSKAFVDVYISTPESLSNSATRAVEERVKYTIMKNEPNIVDADVHAKSSSAEEAMSSSLMSIEEHETHSHSHDDHGHSHSHSHGPAEDSSDVGGMDHAHAAEEEETELTAALNSQSHSSSQEDEIATIPVPSFADEMIGSFEAAPAAVAPSVMSISSFQEVEDDARQLLQDHDSIKSIEGCTVHYDEASQEVQVDVTIKLENPDWTTVTIATSLARELKVILEEGSTNIHKANIFLDLNTAPPREPINGSSMAPTGNNNTISV